jgi:lysophospholipase L1-like esterase
VQVTSAVRLQVTVFLAFGDSLTEGKPGALYVEFPGSYRPYLEVLLRERYVTQDPVIHAAGKGGETAVEGLVRLPADLANFRPGAVLLMEGANDLFTGDPARIEPAIEAIRQMIVAARRAGSLAFVATLPPQIPGAKRAKGEPYVRAFNDRLRTVVSQENAVLVDVWEAFGGLATRELVDEDGLHLTVLGYQKVGDTFFKAIVERLEVKVP